MVAQAGLLSSELVVGPAHEVLPSQLDATVLSALASAMSATMSLSLRRYGRSGGRYAATDAYERNDSPRSGSPRCSGVCSTGLVKRESQPPRSSPSPVPRSPPHLASTPPRLALR